MMLVLILFVMLLSCFFTMLLHGSNSFIKKTTSFISFLPQILCMYVLWFFNFNDFVFQFVNKVSLNWISSFFILAIDSMSIWLLILLTALTPICILLIPTKSISKFKIISCLVFILQFCLAACLLVQDVLLFYILFEISLLPLFILILLAGSGSRFASAAYRLIFYTVFGSLLMLPALILIYFEIGSLNFIDLVQHKWSFERQILLFIAFSIVFLIKLPIVPFHHWLPLAHVSAPTVGSVLLAGIVLKLGCYGLIKYSYVLFYDAWLYYSPFILFLSIFSLFYSSLLVIGQLDLKTIIALSSVSHMSIVTIILSASFFGGITICTMLLISHGFVSPGLFICVGCVYDRYHTKIINYLIGITNSMPLWIGFFYFFTLCNAAIPLSANFISEFLTISILTMLDFWIGLITCLFLILPSLYSFFCYVRIFGGYSFLSYSADIIKKEFLSCLILLFYTIVLGIFPMILFDTCLIFDLFVFVSRF